MREIVTGPAATGTINEHEMPVMTHGSTVYCYPIGLVEQGHGVANVSIDQEAEVHRNVAVGETEAAQIKLVCTHIC